MGDLGTNIRNLREAFGETQLELAQALGYESPATISMYESGARGQNNYEVISKIAYHYRITESQLFHGDFSGWDMESVRLDDAEFTRKAFHYILPVIHTDDAMKDVAFRKGYDLHVKLHVRIQERHRISKKEFLSCLQAYGESETLAAVANSVWWLLFYGFWLFHGDMVEGMWQVQDKKLTKKEFYKKYYLRDIGVEETERLLQRKKLKERYFNEFGERLHEALVSMYAADGWWAEAEYFSALKYVFGLVQNGYDEVENFRIGNEMMNSLRSMGSIYARGFRKIIEQLHRV